MQLELVLRDGAAQFVFQRKPRVGGRAHIRIEEAIAVAAGGFGAVERHVRHFQQAVGIGAVLRRQRNADAGADIDLVAIDVERLGEDLDDAIGKRAGGFALTGLAALNDGKFVAAEPCQHVGFPQQRLEPRRCLPQQSIARGMAKRIVDVLEAVEIEQQDGERIPPPALACRRFFDLLRDRGTIGQTRQRVMMRHERDALLRFLAFGDVVDDDDQIFRLAVIVADDDAAGRINARPILGVDVVFEVLAVAAVLQDLTVHAVDEFRGPLVVECEHGFADKLVASEATHRLERAIDQNELAGHGVLHDHRNRNVVDDRIQKLLGLVELLFGAALLGDVVVGRDPAAARKRLTRHADQLAVGMFIDTARSLSQRGAPTKPTIAAVLRRCRDRPSGGHCGHGGQ